ncbi:MAG: membrane protein insertion efficiency factor YidD [FCB group bacterium]|nr:membrane protein insertion efficiency factor YidD [FCB group bacterium]
MKIFIKILVFTSLATIMLYGQSKYPADTILTNPHISFAKKIGILPIAAWQRLSYNTNFLNCQFYPSCSNYGAQAIHYYGILAGTAQAADRIVRCNPMARYYHIRMNGQFHVPDDRLIDPVKPVNQLSAQKTTKSPVFAAALSAMIPGAGRVYAGRWYDGLMGFMLFALTGTSALDSYRRHRPVATPLFTGLALSLYAGEIYGAYRTARYYQPLE